MNFFFFLLLLSSAFAQEITPAPEVPRTTAFSKMLITSEINLLGFEWKDINLEREAQFSAPLMRSWEKWLKEHLPSTVGEVKVCELECLAYQEKWEEKLPEDLVATPDPNFQNILWMKIGLNIRRSLINNIQTFNWEGRVLLLDGNTKKTIATVTLPREQKEWMNEVQSEVNTGLVSRVYRTPLGAFPQLVQKTESIMPLNRVIKLVITGQKNLGDVTKLVELLQTRGSSLGLQMEMSEFGTQQAIMKGYFRGEEKSFTDLLSQVKELKSSYNYSLVNEVTGQGHVIRMVKE